jgi:hypothetical protein
MKCSLVDCTNEVAWSGKGRKSLYCSEACKQKAKRVRNQTKRVNRMREQRSKLYVVQISLDIANQFVRLHHRHNNPVPLHRFSLGAIDETGLLRGVAIVNNPIVPQLMDGQTLEVNRIATDGCPNACSFLYAGSRTATFALGYRKLITYTLQSESGSSLRGAGWQKVKEVEAHKGWAHRPGRKKLEVYNNAKWRWETINPEFVKNKERPTHIILPPAMTATNIDAHLQLGLFESENVH